MGFFDTNNHTNTNHLNFRFPKTDEIADKLNDYITHNKMDMIETFIQTFKFSNNEAINEWLFDYGGIEAIRNWRKFDKNDDIEKENFPNAYSFKRECIYNLDNYEIINNLTPAENDSQQDIFQEAEIISVDIPDPPIERIANAVEQINNKIPEATPEKNVSNFSEITDVTKHLIQKDMVYLSEGKVITLKGLNPIAKEWVCFTNQPITKDYIQSTFLNKNKRSYSSNACRVAAAVANRNIRSI
ncbi:MAG: hypothetical protein LBB98_10750 [Treponema sp.]|jgi:hypothetical protein|nr:hypothetical protein [Treponema sp.]